MNLSDYSIDELQKLQGQIEVEIRQRNARKKKELVSKVKALAAAGGYTLEELVEEVSSSAGSKPTRVVAPKYRHPSDSSLKWTGRGKTPRWVAELLGQGKTLSDLTI